MSVNYEATNISSYEIRNIKIATEKNSDFCDKTNEYSLKSNKFDPFSNSQFIFNKIRVPHKELFIRTRIIK